MVLARSSAVVLGCALLTGCGRVAYTSRRAPDAADAHADHDVGTSDATPDVDATPDAAVDRPLDSRMEAPLDGDAAGSLDSDLDADLDVGGDVADAADTLDTADAGDAPVDASRPAFAIIDPPAPMWTTDETTILVRGICDPDVTVTTPALYVDSDCTDGTWSASLTFDPEGSTGGLRSASYNATKPVDGGSMTLTASVVLRLVPIPVLIDLPVVTPSFVATGPAVVGGSCATDLVNLQTDVGSIADGDCRDGRWSLAPLPFVDGTFVDITITGERTSARGNTIMGRDRIRIAFDSTPPGSPTSPLLRATTGSSNFPSVTYRAPASINPPGFAAQDIGTCYLATDPACSVLVAGDDCEAGTNAGFSLFGEYRVWVPDNSSTTFYGFVTDVAGNRSACVPLGTYDEVSPITNPTVCDETISADMTAAEWTTFLTTLATNAPTHLATEGYVLVCIDADVTITLGGRHFVDIPNLVIRGGRGPSGTLPFCTLESAPGECARFVGRSNNDSLNLADEVVLENISVLGGAQIELRMNLVAPGPTLRRVVLDGAGFGVIAFAYVTGPITDSQVRVTRGSSLAFLAGSVAAIDRNRIEGDLVLYLGSAMIGSFAGNDVRTAQLLYLQDTIYPFGSFSGNRIALTTMDADLVVTFSPAVANLGFFRTDRIDYSLCLEPGASLNRVRYDNGFSTRSLPFTPNTVGPSGPLGVGTFPDPTSITPCP